MKILGEQNVSDYMTPEAVVVPFDYSDRSKYALDYVLKHCDPGNVHAICLVEHPDPFSLEVPWDSEADETSIRNCRERFGKLYDKTSYPGLHFEAKFGEPASEIVHFAQHLNATMIVMSTHGRTGVKRLLLGSVAHKVSVLAACPVTLLSNAWLEAEQQRELAATL